MDYSLAYCRDRLSLDRGAADLIDAQLSATGVKPGTSILIAGREVTISGTFEISGHDVVLLADRLDGSQGTIVVRAPDVPARE